VLLHDEVDDFLDPAIQKAVEDAKSVYRVDNNNEQNFVPIHPETREDLVDPETGDILISKSEYESADPPIASTNYEDLSIVGVQDLVSVSDMHKFWREHLKRQKDT